MSGHTIRLSQFLTIVSHTYEITPKRREKGVKIGDFQNEDIFSEIYTKNAIRSKNISP